MVIDSSVSITTNEWLRNTQSPNKRDCDSLFVLNRTNSFSDELLFQNPSIRSIKFILEVFVCCWDHTHLLKCFVFTSQWVSRVEMMSLRQMNTLHLKHFQIMNDHDPRSVMHSLTFRPEDIRLSSSSSAVKDAWWIRNRCFIPSGSEQTITLTALMNRARS